MLETIRNYVENYVKSAEQLKKLEAKYVEYYFMHDDYK